MCKAHCYLRTILGAGSEAEIWTEELKKLPVLTEDKIWRVKCDFFSHAFSRSTDLLPRFTQCFFEDHIAHLPSGFVRHSQCSVVCVAESYHLQPFWLGRWSRLWRKVYFFLRLGSIRKNSLTVRVVRHWNRVPCPGRGRVTIPGAWRCLRGIWCWVMVYWLWGYSGSAGWMVGLGDLFQPWWLYDLMKKLLFRDHFGKEAATETGWQLQSMTQDHVS